MNNPIKPIIPVLHLADLTDNELDTYSQEKLDKLTGNAHYPDISAFPELQGMSNALTSYRTALAKTEDGTSVDKEDKDQKRILLEGTLVALAIRCAQITSGDKIAFRSSGFETRKDRTPIGRPTKTESFEAFDGHSSGVIEVAWKPVNGAVVYHVEMTETPQVNSTWQMVPVPRGGVSTKSSTEITGLTPGTRYWFRVAGFNSYGLGEYSEQAVRISQ